MRKKKITILGGCGLTGTFLTGLLLQHTDFFLTATYFKHKPPENHFNCRAESRERLKVVFADTYDILSLRNAIKGAHLVILTIVSNAFSPVIIQACLEEGCDYLDILEIPGLFHTIKQYEKGIKENRSIFITQGGLTPGLPSLLARFISEKYTLYKKIRIGNIMSFKTTKKPEQVYDIFDFVLKNKLMIYEKGKWGEQQFKDARKDIYYGGRFKTVSSIPMILQELDGLPEKLGLTYLGCFGAVTNMGMYSLLKKLLTWSYKIKPRLGWHLLAKMLLAQSHKNTEEPDGFSIVLSAWKDDMKVIPDVEIIIEHEDNYYSTAVVAFLVITEYFSGSFQDVTGVYFMGHILNPDFLQKLPEYGIRYEIKNPGDPLRQ